MAPNLALSQHEQIRDMIISKFANATIARTVRCSTRSVQTIRSNLRCFGTTKAPPNGVGRRRTITPPMLSALLEQLIEKPELYQDEMATFLYDEFDVVVTTPTICRALASAGWSRKAARLRYKGAKRRPARLLPPQFIGTPFIPLGVH
jgi:transposase